MEGVLWLDYLKRLRACGLWGWDTTGDRVGEESFQVRSDRHAGVFLCRTWGRQLGVGGMMVLLVLFYIPFFAIAVALDFWVDGLIRAFGPSCRVVL